LQQGEAALRFMAGAGIPFTDSLAERPVGMIKARARISGRLRSREHAAGFLRMRSRLDACRKRGIGRYKAIAMRAGGKIFGFVTEALSRKAESPARREAARRRCRAFSPMKTKELCQGKPQAFCAAKTVGLVP
jgi:hypothetical protein